MTPAIKRIFGYGSTQLCLMSDGTVRYHYWLDESHHWLDADDGGDSCTFSLWSEVGEPYRPKFLKIIEEYGIGIIRGATLLDGSIGDVLFQVTTDKEPEA